MSTIQDKAEYIGFNCTSHSHDGNKPTRFCDRSELKVKCTLVQDLPLSVNSPSAIRSRLALSMYMCCHYKSPQYKVVRN